MMNLVDYVEKQYSKTETPNLSKEEIELASKINTYFIEHKPMFRKEVLDYFGISKHMFYKLKNVNAIRVPYEISNRTYSSRNKGKGNHGQRTKKSNTQI
jgi:DNA invertase Pin-like site-specific DNA recombinase